ncbi:MAG: PAS domain S-box protein [Methanobacterium sp.]|nr:PAS domain S-box protein [Methanobacterium sp.]
MDKSIINSEKWLKTIIEASPDAIVVTDLDGNIIECNQLAVDISVFKSKEELIGFNGLNAIHPEDLERIKRDIKKLFLNGVMKDAEYRILNKKGRVFPVEISASVIFDNSGNPDAIICILKDITKRKKAEDTLQNTLNNLEIKVKERTKELEDAYEALSESEEKFRELFNRANDIITLSELTEDGMPGKFIEVNNAALQRLGYSRDELLNMTPLDIIQKRIEDTPNNAQKIREEGSSRFEAVHIAKDGSKIPVEINTHLFKFKGKNVILGISRDITERKKAEEELKNSEAYYRTIFENTGTATFIVEKDCTISLMNAECERISGYSKEEVEGKKKWQELVSADCVKKMEDFHNLRRINPEVAPRNYEFEFIDKFGNIKNVTSTVDLIPGTKKTVVSLLDVTEKNIAENALRKSEAQLRIAMDLAKLVSWEYDVESDMFTFDDHFYALYGTTAEKEGGTKMSSKEYARRFIPPEESSIVAEETMKALETDDPDFFRQVEHNIIRADGKKRTIIVRYGVIKDEKGRTIKTYGANQDITENKLSEQRSKEMVKFLQILIDTIPSSIFYKDIKGIYQGCNKAYEDFTGLKKKDIIGKSVYDIFPKDQADKYFEMDLKLLENPGKQTYEWRMKHANGSIRDVIFNKATYFNTDGTLAGLVAVMVDITERKELENKSIEHLQRLDILNKIIVTANRSGSVKSLLKDVLAQTLNLLPFDSGEIYLIDKNKGIAKIFHSKGTSGSFNTIKIDEQPHRLIYINGKSAFRSDLDKISIDISNKSDMQSIAIVPLFSEGEIIGSLSLGSRKKHYFGNEEKELIKSIGNEIGNVISKLIAEEEMEKLIEELKRSNEELEQFAYITSHDLQEPLRTIASFTQLLERRYKGKLDPDADEFIEFIVSASIRMKEMIQGLLEYSRIGKEELKFKPVNPEKVLKEALSNLKIVIEENNATITWEKLPEVIGDSKLLVQLFQNLISNAIKFKKSDEPPEIHISFIKYKNGYKNVFCVEDNGIGIDQQFAERIFKVFKRLHTIDEYKGTGIGLATCRRIIEYHKGHIWVESKLNKGSKFYFTLKQ